jgi:proline iminopeptidase
MVPRRTFYPECQPYRRGRLAVSDRHEMYFEECGNPNGKPVVLPHGGPGSGISPNFRRLHDPQHYRIILFDQRGCGQSTPYADLTDNTTWHLVSDMEKLRQHLGLERWQIVGGSWGATLALAYAEAHPERVTELVVRSVFAGRRREIRWFYQEGANALFPEAWEAYLAPIPGDERHDLVAAYYRRLTGSDEVVQIACAKSWSQWEGAALSLLPDPQRVDDFGDPHFAVAFARIESHYFYHGAFLERDDQLIANAHRLRHIPGAIVQGRYDIVTPFETAYDLHKAWPEAAFMVIPDAGHAMSEPGITDALIKLTEQFR